MSGIFRQLCNVLADEAFAIVKGLGEAAVIQACAKQPAPYQRPSEVSLLRDHIDHGGVGRYLCAQFGWKAVTAWRSAEHDALVVVAKLPCGHKHHFSIEEWAIADCAKAELLDLIVKKWQKSARQYPCYCVPLAGYDTARERQCAL